MTIRIFYSWQSRTAAKYNRYFIQDCLERAVKLLKKLPEFSALAIEILEGVRGEPGSVPVAAQIVDKRIPKCDIFLADVSVTNAPPKRNKLQQFIHAFAGNTCRPFQNNNVLFEYGVAYNSLGAERIICVLNADYGSPNDNPDNIPFDIAHLRFPLEYRYSVDGSTTKEAAQKTLVGDLLSALKATVKYALQHQRSKYAPLIVWRDWEERIRPAHRFYTNEHITKLGVAIKQAVQTNASSIRLLGLPGLGKTRLLLELFRPQLDEQSILLSSRVLYLNCHNHSGFAYETVFTKLAQDKDDHIVVLDNCPPEVHRSLLPIVHNPDNKLFLLTMDSSPEEQLHSEITGVRYLALSISDLASVVDDLLDAELKVLGADNIARIKEFAQGIPLMAVLLADSLKKGEPLTGRMSDKELLDNLLGEKGKDERWRTILKSCALFSYLGVRDEVRSQVEFVATNKAITSLDGDPTVIIQDFDKVLRHYQQREIIEGRGRYVSLRPFPLAMYLLQEWLEACSPDRFVRVLDAIASLPESDRKKLTAALAEQMKYLGFDDQAIGIVDKMLGPGGAFDDVEVLNTELGSRLLRSFTEVHPVAVANNLVRQLTGLTQAQLQTLEQGRRNLVWVLEKLCFDRRTFADSAKVLYALAVAENEMWANNATGQLVHLFSVLLAGTEANLAERWQLLEWGLAQQQEDYDKLAIRGMRVGLGFGHFTRMNGAETQGTKTLQDYRPTEEEMGIYWSRIIARLAVFVEEKSPHAETASSALLGCLRDLCRAGQLSLLVPTLQRLVASHHIEGQEAIQSVRNTLRFERHNLTLEERTSLEQLLAELDKSVDDFQTRYANLQNADVFLEERYSGEKHQELIVALADEFINQHLEWNEHLPLLYKQRQPYSYYFGKRLYELVQADPDLIERFIHDSLQILRDSDADTRDQSLLAGFMAEVNSQVRAAFYEQLLSDEQLRCQLFYFIASDSDGYLHFRLLHQLVTHGHCSVQEFATLRYGSLLEKLSDNELLEFSEQLFTYGEAGYRVALDLYFSLVFHEVRLRELLLPVLEECVRNLGVAEVLADPRDPYRGNQVISWLLQDGNRTDFAALVNRSVIASISWEKDYHLDNESQRIYELLLKRHFSAVWPDLSVALLASDDEYTTFYGLKNILGSGIGRSSRSIGVLFDGDIEAIFVWCQVHQPLAPARLAELTPIFEDQEDTAPTYVRARRDEDDTVTDISPPALQAWHPVAKRLLDEFGNVPEVLENLSANMGSYSWTGSIVQLLKGKQRLFEALRSHAIPAVALWASRNTSALDAQIRQEEDRDSEMYLH